MSRPARTARALALAACLAPGLLACAGVRGRSERAAPPEPVAQDLEKGDALHAAARRELMTRAAGRLRASVAETEADAVRALLESQAAAWNRGDLEGFMAGYEQSDAVRFASGDTVVRGWARTLGRYRERYPDRAAMGLLSFSGLEIDILAADAAVAFGRWRLVTSSDVAGGLFTLELRKTDAGWVIVRDHTSAGEQP